MWDIQQDMELRGQRYLAVKVMVCEKANVTAVRSLVRGTRSARPRTNLTAHWKDKIQSATHAEMYLPRRPRSYWEIVRFATSLLGLLA